MPEFREFARFASFLPEPLVLVSRSGRLLGANAAALESLPLAGHAIGGDSPASLAALTGRPAPEVARFLKRCSRSTRLVPGGPILQGDRETYHCSGARLVSGMNGGDGAGGGPLHPGAAPSGTTTHAIVLRFRLRDEAMHTFKLLNQQVDRLARELHERRRMEAELRRQAERLQEYALELKRQRERAQAANLAKTEFLGGMSHELRTPLNAIIGYVDLLEAEVSGPINDDQRRQLQRLRRGADHLVALISEILEFARMDAGAGRLKPQEIDVAHVARQALEMIEPVAREAGLEVEVELPDEPLRIVTDPDKLRQALLNLLSNAVKFTASGAVGLAVRPTEVKERVEFRVHDTGPGIEPQYRERIFEPFWQVGKGGRGALGGTGMGLPVARELARLLNGEIVMHSTSGEGSTFVLTVASLPAPGA